MKTTITTVTAVVLIVFAGCEPTAEEKKLPGQEKGPLVAGKELLTVDFQEGQTLRYKFVCGRDIGLDWNPEKSATKSGKSTVDKSTESMEMVVAYTPAVEVNPYGLTAIKATCESVKIKRSKGPRRDAVESLAGKTFTFTVGPTGKIEDYSQLESLIRETGNHAFRADTGRGRIKEPDMIGDFISTQWFLWDSVSSIEIEKAIEGISKGQTWKSKLPVPGPMVMRKARDVTYTLDEIRQTPKGRLAVIHSSYSPSESVGDRWPPMPYSGRFRMSGTFGFLRGYKVLDLQGRGEELFNIDAGRIEQYNQQYKVQLEAFIPMGMNVKPRIIMEQNFTMQLIE